MVLANEDQYGQCLWEPETGPKKFTDMVPFLRARYETYVKNETGESRFFLIDIGVANSARRKNESKRRRRNVALYFQKKDFYLRGWTIDGDAPEDCFMAAWDTDTEFKERDPLSLLPGWRNGQTGRGYIGSPPNTAGSYIDISYDKDGQTKDEFSKTKFFDHTSTLYEYLYRLKHITGRARTRDDIKEDKEKAQAALHSLAKMTSEMARFDPYFRQLCHNWESRILSNVRPRSEYDWGKKDNPNMHIPEFSWTLLKWKKCTEKADENEDTKKPSTLKYDGVDVTSHMAQEVLGANGSRWRKVS